MAGDIEEFLRRAAARRQQRQGQPPQQAGQAAPQGFAPQQPQIQIIEPTVEAEVIEAEPVHESVSQHVTQYLASDEFGQRTSHLGEHVGQADDQMKSHLSQVFEHRVGDLGATTSPVQMEAVGTVGDEAPSVHRSVNRRADEISAMFRSPRSLRQAIILSEIMNRPVDRW
jgi:hypothetical protein